MAATNNRIKVSALAKDFDVKNKALLTQVEGLVDAKATTLAEEEADLIIYRLAGLCTPADIDKYINGEIKLAPYKETIAEEKQFLVIQMSAYAMHRVYTTV